MMLIITFTILVYHLRTITCGYGDVAGCWPNNIIPFKILPGFSENQTNLIQEVIGQFHRQTCIRWVDEEKHYNSTEYVVFQKMEESYICRTQRKIRDGKAVIELGDACFSKSVVMHEMMHLLGFEHEHQRADRDCYVEFDETKVSHSEEKYAIKHKSWLERFPYDKLSNMHYPRSVALRARTETEGGSSSLSLEYAVYAEEPLGNQSGELTGLDLWKILYRFCGFPHFCDFFPQICVFMDEIVRLIEEKLKYRIQQLGTTDLERLSSESGVPDESDDLKLLIHTPNFKTRLKRLLVSKVFYSVEGFMTSHLEQ